MFFSSKPASPPADETSATTTTSAGSMDSDAVKKAIIRQILVESNTSNAKQLIQNINDSCFEKCIPKPGASISSGEQTCVTQCMEKYMAAWNMVNTSYIRRLQQEAGANNLGV